MFVQPLLRCIDFQKNVEMERERELEKGSKERQPFPPTRLSGHVDYEKAEQTVSAV